MWLIYRPLCLYGTSIHFSFLSASPQTQRTRTPDLAPEDSQPIWSRGTQRLPSASTMKQRFRDFITKIYDVTGDPRIGPFLLLGALMSFGSIWLQRRQPTQQQNQPERNQPHEADSKVSDGLTILKVFRLSYWLLTNVRYTQIWLSMPW